MEFLDNFHLELAYTRSLTISPLVQDWKEFYTSNININKLYY